MPLGGGSTVPFNGYLIKIIPGNDHLKELREKAKEYLKNKEYSNQNKKDWAKEQDIEIVFWSKSDDQEVITLPISI